MLTKNSSRCIIDTLSSTEKDILLSITIPTFKRFSLLKETLRSVFENQFSFPVEVIIVDNDPENEEQALEEMSEFSINEFRYYKNTQNYGMFGNWNQCLTLARGKYITILHDDDLLKKNFALVTSREITKGLHAFGFQWRFWIREAVILNQIKISFMLYLKVQRRNYPQILMRKTMVC